MIVGSVSENKDFEKRISITPEIAKKYIANGFEVMIESNIATHLGITDEEFEKEGCKVVNRENVLSKSDIILQLSLLDEKSTESLKENNILIGNFNSTKNQEALKKYQKKKYLFFQWSFYLELLGLNQWIYYHLKQTSQAIKLL